MSDYEDIIDLPHWEPHGRTRISMEARAAQFAAFAALKESEAAGNEEEEEEEDSSHSEEE
ncbi:MAG: hypothetical protein K2J00_05585 [Bacteroidaceae bacterium]|nr:hypothetical protein [Bacteroidaceae bacterium]